MMGGFFRGFGTGNGVKKGVGHRKKIVFGEKGWIWARGRNGLPALNATGRFEKSNSRNIVWPPLELVKSQK